MEKHKRIYWGVSAPIQPQDVRILQNNPRLCNVLQADLHLASLIFIKKITIFCTELQEVVRSDSEIFQKLKIIQKNAKA